MPSDPSLCEAAGPGFSQRLSSSPSRRHSPSDWPLFSAALASQSGWNLLCIPCASLLDSIQLGPQRRWTWPMPAFELRSGAHTWTMAEGLIQGDPLSPLLFALGVQPALDDLALVAPAATVPAVIKTLEQHLQEAEALQQALGGGVVVRSLNVLGSVVHLSNAEPPVPQPMDPKLFHRLETVPSLQIRLLLLRHCISRQHLHVLYTEICLPLQLGGLGLPCLADQDEFLQRWTESPHLAEGLADATKIVSRASTIMKMPIKFPASGQDAQAEDHQTIDQAGSRSVSQQDSSRRICISQRRLCQASASWHQRRAYAILQLPRSPAGRPEEPRSPGATCDAKRH
eukprot:m.59789 g.59789  ORF g.59789 m.59789 type:complete len:342 (+) comp49277_c0_seq4:391-1416(+)